MTIRFTDKIGREDWRNALIGGVVVGALPVLGIGWFLLDRNILGDPHAALMFGIFALFTGGMFAAFGAAITLFFSVLVREWPQAGGHVRAEYQAFAEAVGGELQLEQAPVPFHFFGSFPRRVAFSHKGRDAILEIVEQPGGDNTITYTRLTVALMDAPDFRCEIYPSGTLTRLAEFFGAQDVQIGSREFDERFTVRTDDEVQAVRLLNAELQQTLHDFTDWAKTVRDRSVLGSRFMEVCIAERSLRIDLVGFLESSAKLLEFVERAWKMLNVIDR